MQGHQIFYRTIGNGRPVVLIHGFGEESNVWENQIELLKDKFQLIIPELPGSGHSEIIADMSIDGMAEVIHFIIQHEKIEQCIVIGHSMGGYITLAFAEKYQEYLSAFGLFHSTAYPDNEEKKEVRRKGIEFIKEKGPFEFLRTSIPNQFSPITKKQNPDLVDEFIDGLRNFSADVLVSYYEAMIKRPDRTKVLKKATAPVLFVMGEHDNAVPLQDVLKQCHLPEKSYIHILYQSGHLGMLEEAEKSNRILEKFLLGI